MIQRRLLGRVAFSFTTIMWLSLSVQAQFPDSTGNHAAYGAEEYYRIGMACADQKEYDEAIKNLKRAISLRPDFALAYNDLGYIHYQAGQPEEAVKNYR